MLSTVDLSLLFPPVLEELCVWIWISLLKTTHVSPANGLCKPMREIAHEETSSVGLRESIKL